MTKHEYHDVCQAIRHFKSGDTRIGMDILAKLTERHDRFALRHLRPKTVAAAEAARG